MRFTHTILLLRSSNSKSNISYQVKCLSVFRVFFLFSIANKMRVYEIFMFLFKFYISVCCFVIHYSNLNFHLKFCLCLHFLIHTFFFFFQKITFNYPRTLEELLHQVASLHESPTPPSLIIVDRLEGFLCSPAGGSNSGLHSGDQSCAAHLSALLCDTAAFLTQVLEQRGSRLAPCRIIASFLSDNGEEGKESSATGPILDVLDRYFQVRCTLDRDIDYKAAALPLQELWHIYLSGRGIREASFSEDCEGRPGVAQEWELLIFPDGLMEFKLV